MLKLRMPCSWIQPGSVVVNVAAQPNLCEETILQVPGVRYVPKIGTQRLAYAESHAHRHLISREILKSQYPSISLCKVTIESTFLELLPASHIIYQCEREAEGEVLRESEGGRAVKERWESSERERVRERERGRGMRARE